MIDRTCAMSGPVACLWSFRFDQAALIVPAQLLTELQPLSSYGWRKGVVLGTSLEHLS